MGIDEALPFVAHQFLQKLSVAFFP